MTSVGFEVALAEPSAFVAITRERRRKPASACRRTYALSVAFEIRAQSEASGAPRPSHRNQRYSYVIGAVPVHVPLDVRSVWPTRGVPVIWGSPLFRGAVVTVFGATIAVGRDADHVMPAAFRSITRTRSRLPSSLLVREDVLVPMSLTSMHLLPNFPQLRQSKTIVTGSPPAISPAFAVNVPPTTGFPTTLGAVTLRGLLAADATS